MKSQAPLFSLLFSFSSLYSSYLFGQGSNDSKLIGTWKGTSICQIKESPCKNEQVVCHISKDKDSDEYLVQMNKMVKGAEEEMGTLKFTFHSDQKELDCSPKPNTVWRFRLNDDRLDGTLYYNGALYRIISVKRSN